MEEAHLLRSENVRSALSFTIGSQDLTELANNDLEKIIDDRLDGLTEKLGSLSTFLTKIRSKIGDQS